MNKFNDMQAVEVYKQMLEIETARPVVTYNVDTANLLKLTDQQHKQLKPEHFSRITELTEEARNKAMRDRFDSVRYTVEQNFSPINEELSPMQELIKEHIKGADMEFMKTEEGLDLILGKLRHLITNQKNENELSRKKIQAYEQVAKKVPHIHREAKKWKTLFKQSQDLYDLARSDNDVLRDKLENEMQKTYPLKVEIEKLKKRIDENEDTEKMYEYNERANQLQTELDYTKRQLQAKDEEIAEMSEENHFMRKELAHYRKEHLCDDHQQIEYEDIDVYANGRVISTIKNPVRVTCLECKKVLWEEGEQYE